MREDVKKKKKILYKAVIRPVMTCLGNKSRNHKNKTDTGYKWDDRIKENSW